MKQNYLKGLLCLLMMVLGMSAWADTTVTKTASEIANANEWTTASGTGTQTCYTSFNLDANITISTSGSANCGSYWGSDWRLYQAQNGDVTVTAASGYEIVSVTYTYNVSKTGTLKDGSTTISSGTSISVNSSSKTLTVGNSGTATNGQVRITQFSVVYKPDGSSSKTTTTTSFGAGAQSSYTIYMGDAFTAPTATVTGGEGLVPTYSSSNTDVANVNASTGAVTLEGPGVTTITASYAGDANYESSNASYTLTVGGVYTNIQALQAGVQATELPMKLTLSDVTVTGVNGNNAYISDGTYGAIIYTANHGLTVGQTISGTLTATCVLFNGAAEIKNYTAATSLTINPGTLGDAPVVTISGLSKANQSKYCKLENVSYNATALTFSDGTNTIAYYDGLKTTLSLTDGKNYDVVGIVSYRKTNTAETLQFFPISIEEKVAAVEAPIISLATGSYKGTQSVTITDGTAGAEIYYTLDGTDPTTSGTAVKYTAAISITENKTLTAAAKKDDTWSNTVSSVYTITPLYANIKAAKEAMTATAKEEAVDCYITLNNAIVTAIVDGATKTYYIEDATAGVILYSSAAAVTNKLTKVGLVLNGDLKCAGYIYNGLHEYTKNFDFTDVTITENGTIPCTTVEIADLLADGGMAQYESMRIKIVEATVSSALSSRKATIAQGEKNIQIYEKVKDALGTSTGLSTANAIVSVIGYPGMNNTTNQLNVLATSDLETAGYSLTISDAKYATYYNSSLAYTLPANMEGYIWTDRLEQKYYAGDVVPAGEALVLKADAGNYTLNFTTGPTVGAGNKLLGTDTETALTADADSYFYGLSLNAAGNAGSVGFYWMAADGAAFTNGAHKAYLKLPKSSGVKCFLFETENADAIQNVATETENKVIYNLAGQRVNKAQKGLYIVNGKKVMY